VLRYHSCKVNNTLSRVAEGQALWCHSNLLFRQGANSCGMI